MSNGLRYKDKVTIVTGGSRGIGLGIVEVFGKQLYILLLFVPFNVLVQLIALFSFVRRFILHFFLFFCSHFLYPRLLCFVNSIFLFSNICKITVFIL